MERKKVKRTIYIDPNLDDRVLKYMSKLLEDKKKVSYSEVIQKAIEDFFKVEATKDSLDLTTQIIDKCIGTHIAKFFDRMIALESKNTKINYSSIYLLCNLLATMYQTDDERTFIKDKIKEADELRI